MLEWHSGRALPYWTGVVTIDGATPDLSTGYTFDLAVASTATAAPVLSKTAGITGAAGGTFEVAWAVGDLDLDPGLYAAQLTVTRADGKSWTVDEVFRIHPTIT